MKDLPFKIVIFGVRRGPLRGHVGAMLGSSWHLQGILTSLLIILATKVDIRGGDSLFGGGQRGPGGPWGGGFRGREYGSMDWKPIISHANGPKARRISIGFGFDSYRFVLIRFENLK